MFFKVHKKRFFFDLPTPDLCYDVFILIVIKTIMLLN